ncbi:VRR-NUC domain-containing protein [Pseudomonas aeruginosa]|uniref:VRR-NUC domain-containing protein n=2 Tax=Pseudomonas aeruginosa group TaxID=136841 RepID=UPI00130171F8|nr:VRR-NUC domain-containing protein [Pseudomonas aeruginosa]
MTNPLDLWYLCEKARYASANPYRRAGDEAPMYQRTVALMIRVDNELFEYRWPYCAEVGYDMTKTPPAPIMSKKQAHRPSSFPLSQYKRISSHQFPQYSSLEVVVDILGLDELENLIEMPLPSHVEDGIWQDIQVGQKGKLRIPDVVRVINHTMGGKPQYSQPNLASVIEMKFGGDTLSKEQKSAYEEIAGSSDKFRLLHTDRCERADRRQRREWMTAAQKEPVYKPVSQVMSVPLRASADPHGLVVGLIDAEHQAARRVLEVKPLPPGTPVMSASPDMREANARAERARAQIELTLMAPFIAVAGVGLGAGAATVTGGGTVSGAALTARAGPQVVRYNRLIDWARLAGGASSAGATLAYATAEDGSSAPVLSPEQQRLWEAYQEWEASQRHQPRTEQLYLFWPDAPETKP